MFHGSQALQTMHKEKPEGCEKRAKSAKSKVSWVVVGMRCRIARELSVWLGLVSDQCAAKQYLRIAGFGGQLIRMVAFGGHSVAFCTSWGMVGASSRASLRVGESPPQHGSLLCDFWAALSFVGEGIGGGAATVFVPLYLGQIAPLELRGAIGNLHQVAIVFGLLVAQLAGASLSWPCALALAASFGIVQILLMPRLLGVQEQRAQEYDGTEAIGASTGFQALLTDSRVRRPLHMAIILMALQQYSGINGIWFYSTEFFARAGLSNPLAGTLLSSLVFMLATFLSVLLIEKAGRRALMLRGQAGALLSLSLLTLALCLKSVGCLVTLQSYLNMLVVTAVLGFVTSFAISLGPIPWQIANEIFPLRCRAEAQCLIASFCEVFNASVALGFPVLQRCLGSQLAFAPSVLVLLAGILVVKKNLPETKSREVEDILADFNRRT